LKTYRSSIDVGMVVAKIKVAMEGSPELDALIYELFAGEEKYAEIAGLPLTTSPNAILALIQLHVRNWYISTDITFNPEFGDVLVVSAQPTNGRKTSAMTGGHTVAHALCMGFLAVLLCDIMAEMEDVPRVLN
jgi:hypothetical protein